MITYLLKNFYYYYLKFLFIYLGTPGLSLAFGIFSCSLWDLVPQPEMEPRPPALGARRVSHCITREVPDYLPLPASLKLFGFRTAKNGMSEFLQIHILKPNPQCDGFGEVSRSCGWSPHEWD